MKKQFKINNNLTLVVKPLEQKNQVFVTKNINHIMVVDVSGSMYGEIDKIRQHLKNQTASLLNDGDTLTLIWFSGRGQFGVVFEELEVNTVKDLSNIHKMIDKYLHTVGLTGFKEPLELVNDVINRISKNRPDSEYSLFFMSDGGENQWASNQVLETLVPLESKLSNATFVEYGYYADHRFLNQMAEKCGGSLIFSEDFKGYINSMETILKSKSQGKKITLTLDESVLNNIVTTVINGSILAFPVIDGKVSMPETTEFITYLTDSDIDVDIYEPIYATYVLPMVYIMVNRMKSDIVYDLLNLLGNKDLFEQYSKAIGKQRILNFTNLINYVTKSETDFEYVYDLKTKFNKKTATILDVLLELGKDENNKFYPDHELFSYKRIGKKKEVKTETLTDEDIQTLTEELNKLKGSKDISVLKQQIEEIQNKINNKPIDFVSLDKGKGSNLSNLVFNSERANISVLVKYDGYVVLPANNFETLPKSMFNTWIYRTYTLLADGNVNVKILPISVTQESFDFLQKNELLLGEVYEKDKIYTLDLTQIPVISRDDLKSIDSNELFTSYFELLKIQAKQKVYKYYRNQHFPKVSVGYIEKYGEEAATWLKEIGLTDFNGFAPKMVSSEEVQDVVQVPLLELKAKGLSSLPSVDSVLSKQSSGKPLTISETLMSIPLNDYNSFITSDIYTKSNKGNELLEIWLKDKETEAIKESRALIKKQAKQTFSILIGQVWFEDAEDLSDYKKTLSFDGLTVEMTAKMSEKTIEL